MTQQTISIRQATKEDLSNIAALHAQSWREHYHSVLSKDFLDNGIVEERTNAWQSRFTQAKSSQLVLIAELKNEFVGFICVYGNNHPEHGSIIDNLHVVAKAKGLGIGTKLLHSAATWLVEFYKDFPLYLEVLECNPKAIGFYDSLGGKNVAVSYWHTPCGNDAKEFIYRWPSPECFLVNNNG